MDNNRRLISIVFWTFILVLTIALILLIVIPSATPVLETQKNATRNTAGSTGPRLCTTAACVAAAHRLNQFMNRKVRPCDDFYEYACGSFNKTEPIPDGKTSWSVRDLMDQQLHRDLRRALTSTDIDSVPTDSINVTHKIQRYFHTCMDLDKIAVDMSGLLPLVQFLSKELDFPVAEWPMVGKNPNVTNQHRLKKTIMMARKYDNSLGLFPNSPYPNSSEPKRNGIVFDVGKFTLDRSILLNDSYAHVHKAYVDYVASVAFWIHIRLGNLDKARAMYDPKYRRIFEDILKFERTLANFTLPPEERRRDTGVWHELEISLGEFAVKYFSRANGSESLALHLQADEWVRYFKTAWGSSADNITNETLVVVKEPVYYGSIIQTLQDMEFPDRFLWNYIGWKVIEPLVLHLDPQFLEAYRQFEKTTYSSGLSSSSPRSDVCVDTVNKHFPDVVGSLYVRNFVQRQTKKDVETMAEYVLGAFKDIVKESDWIPETARGWLLRKADKMVKQISYDDYLMSDNNTFLNIKHARFQPDVEEIYFNNYIRGQLFNTQLEGRMFGATYNRTDWSHWVDGPATVTAYYSATHNAMTVAAGYLQEPHFEHGYPWYWNFAIMGFTIGHEITHGFDVISIQFDGEGNYVEWWDVETALAYLQRAVTLVEQYSNFSVMGVQLEGENYLDENIADNGALKEAYKKFLKEVLKDQEEARLPGFEEFSTDQMFFLSFAQQWCGDYGQTELTQQSSLEHSPQTFRVIGPLHNSVEFSKAYQCQPGTYMNATMKAAVW